jgi:hypothetical protein
MMRLVCWLRLILLIRCDVLFAGIQLFVHAGFAGEEDQALLVGLEALDVGFEGFDGEVGASRVDADADCGSEFAGDAGFLWNEDLENVAGH